MAGWPLQPHSQSEDLSVADLDRDGRPDVVLGTRWLRNTGDAWHLRAMDEPPGKPDRNEVGDLDGDGWPDVVVGFEAVSRPGDLVWYRNPAGNGAWRRNPIARMTGPMSLGLGDLDGDSDLDVVVGEHNLVSPGHARLVWFENLGAGVAWRGHRIHQGDEHHDGAVLADLDRDGDLDIASIGWGPPAGDGLRKSGLMRRRVAPGKRARDPGFAERRSAAATILPGRPAEAGRPPAAERRKAQQTGCPG